MQEVNVLKVSHSASTRWNVVDDPEPHPSDVDHEISLANDFHSNESDELPGVFFRYFQFVAFEIDFENSQLVVNRFELFVYQLQPFNLEERLDDEHEKRSIDASGFLRSLEYSKKTKLIRAL
jgi:hypothetical protein